MDCNDQEWNAGQLHSFEMGEDFSSTSLLWDVYYLSTTIYILTQCPQNIEDDPSYLIGTSWYKSSTLWYTKYPVKYSNLTLFKLKDECLRFSWLGVRELDYEDNLGHLTLSSAPTK